MEEASERGGEVETAPVEHENVSAGPEVRCGTCHPRVWSIIEHESTPNADTAATGKPRTGQSERPFTSGFVGTISPAMLFCEKVKCSATRRSRPKA